jgi:hypothetical protein
MRGDDQHPDVMFSCRRPEGRVPPDHSLRRIRREVGVVLRELSPELARLYARTGRPSIAPRGAAARLAAPAALLRSECSADSSSSCGCAGC